MLDFRVVLALMFATVAAAGERLPAVHSAEAPRESRRTLALAPGSSVSPGAAMTVALSLARTVRGTSIHGVRGTGSMRPLFDANALVLSEAVAFDELRIGDIVLFRHPTLEATVVHRIVEKRPRGFWTKGDHNGRMDDVLVTRGNYLGRVYGILYTSRPTECLATPRSWRRSAP